MKNELNRLRISQTSRPLDVVRFWSKEGDLLLSPPYQRGDVWGIKRQRNLIKSILLGIPIPSIIVNDRGSACWDGDYRIAVIDGKQRITAILKFLNDELSVHGEWFGMENEFVIYSQLPIPRQRGIKNHPIPFSEGQLATIEDEREVFDLVNFGGVQQGESDI